MLPFLFSSALINPARLCTYVQLSHKVGVLDVPEVITHQIDADDVFAVWATDGVWEFLDNQQVVDIVDKEAPNLKKAAAALIDAANNQWKSVSLTLTWLFLDRHKLTNAANWTEKHVNKQWETLGR